MTIEERIAQLNDKLAKMDDICKRCKANGFAVTGGESNCHLCSIDYQRIDDTNELRMLKDCQ